MENPAKIDSGKPGQQEESQVYSREEYAKKEFWNDRFKETKGFFDWYANWKEIKPVFEKYMAQLMLGPSFSIKENLSEE